MFYFRNASRLRGQHVLWILSKCSWTQESEPKIRLCGANIFDYPDGLFVTFYEHFHHCRYILNSLSRAMAPPFVGIHDDFRDSDHLQYNTASGFFLSRATLIISKPQSKHMLTCKSVIFPFSQCFIKLKANFYFMGPGR